jgi:hypothetical protein
VGLIAGKIQDIFVLPGDSFDSGIESHIALAATAILDLTPPSAKLVSKELV